MKNLNILFVGLALNLFSCLSQTTEKMQKPIFAECSPYYLPEKGDYIDLENNRQILLEKAPDKEFKTCPKYMHRFWKPYGDKTYADGREFILEVNKEQKIYRIKVLKSGKMLNSIVLPVASPLPDVYDYSFWIMPYEKDIIVYMKDMYTTYLTICKYNSDGKELMRKEIEHTYITHPRPDTDHHNPYLDFVDATASQLVFSSHRPSTGKRKTVILSLKDFSATEYDQSAEGIIFNENEDQVAGIVSANDGHYSVLMSDGKKYAFDIPNGARALDLILKDNLLYIASYHPIATGSSLHCFDLSTGKMKWTADVVQLNASHSKYYNRVTLAMYQNKLILEGNEAYGSYVQLFDAETGKRIANFTE